MAIAFSLCSSGIAEIGTDSARYFIGASPIYEYNRDGSSITAQTAIYAASIRFIQEETSSESIAAQKNVNSRKPYRKINAVLILQESGRFWINARFSAEADSVSYCTEGCPMKIAIPQYFSLYNEDMREDLTEKGWTVNFNNYAILSDKFGKA